jgi:phosphoglycolate phosphatase
MQTIATRTKLHLIRYAVLFDVDGTLISSSVGEENEKRRYVDAIRGVVGIEPLVIPSRFAGMVDPQICRILLAETGLSQEAVDSALPKVLSRMGEVYIQMNKRVELNRGVRELLRILAKSAAHVTGIITGNLLTVANEKLRIVGISEYFAEKFCADTYFERNFLVRDAVEACVNKYQLVDSTNVLIVGDTPRDIMAANEAKAISVGIATGVYSVASLQDAHPKSLFANLAPTRMLLNALRLEYELSSEFV